MSKQTLAQAFSSALGISQEEVVDTLAYRAAPQWDSVAHMKLVFEIEKAFDIMLDTDDVLGMSSFAEARRILVKYGVDFGE